MPAGVPVATVAVNGAANAGILAAQILSLKDTRLAEKLEAYKEGLKNQVSKMNAELEEEGF